MAAEGAYPIHRVAVVGTGVIGSGWVARFLAHGLEVVATDPAPEAEDTLYASIAAAREPLERQGLDLTGWRQRLRFETSMAAALEGADFVQESAPEREELKREILERADATVPADVCIASSSSGLLPSRLQADCRHPERLLIAHPFNPVYLLPLVELVGGEHTASHTLRSAAAFYRRLGMRPLVVRKEIEGYVADRLMEALWREALHLVNDGVATTEEVDAAVTYGAGLRWALMGTYLTFHLAGGEAGMRHMLEQFGPALKLPWTHMDAPELNSDLIERIVAGCEHQAAGRDVQTLARRRDDFLVRLLALVREYWPEQEGLSGRI